MIFPLGNSSCIVYSVYPVYKIQWGLPEIVSQDVNLIIFCRKAIIAAEFHPRYTKIATELSPFGVFGDGQLLAADIGLRTGEYGGGQRGTESRDKYYIAEVIKPVAMLLGGLGFAVVGFWHLFRPHWNQIKSGSVGASFQRAPGP
jgi:hypothetical protein